MPDRNEQRTCVFCGQPSLTKEHLLPRWLVRLFPGGPQSSFVSYSELTSGPERREWPAPKLDYTARVVCARCNNGWMARLEAQTGPILTQLILGAPQTLSIIEQETIGFWAVKTALLLRLAHSSSAQFPRRLYLELLTAQRPPGSNVVWIARCVPTNSRLSNRL